MLPGRIDGRGRIVEDEDRRIREDRTRDRDPLALSARQGEPPLAEHRLVPVRQRRDELPRTGESGGASNRLVVRVRASEADVLANALREEEGFLEDERDRLPDVGEPELPHVMAVQ